MKTVLSRSNLTVEFQTTPNHTSFPPISMSDSILLLVSRILAVFCSVVSIFASWPLVRVSLSFCPYSTFQSEQQRRRPARARHLAPLQIRQGRCGAHRQPRATGLRNRAADNGGRSYVLLDTSVPRRLAAIFMELIKETKVCACVRDLLNL